ncbi:uncharacterized protein LOC105190888 [Harpegnathos saltator]|uniref:Kielin/chordin-like protein n=1 Tax=Harpegnathos saltator TaxID=610380 RepID=E2C7Q6_HARSA|nr:uncharacterized protein LOC105190888 [Harpegnathos saltator]EFN76039.1 hypothetical protein EAI_16142 [Harpegnathos saltator]
MLRRSTYFIIQKCTYLAVVATIVAADQENCDNVKCVGPLMYYNSLGCKPIYKKEGDCCALKYNCDHLKARSKDKCYVNNNVYEIDELLKDEDGNRCDQGCRCGERKSGYAGFWCALTLCVELGPIRSGCYTRENVTMCCPTKSELACPGLQRPRDRLKCRVNGTTYFDGQRFWVPDGGPYGSTCVCQEGYKGENVPPFCMKVNRQTCDPFFQDASYVHEQCAPIYYRGQDIPNTCNGFWTCQNADDQVIHTHESHETPEEECYFGNLTLHHHDKLNKIEDGWCMKCVCEVPPVPTCLQVPAEQCKES